MAVEAVSYKLDVSTKTPIGPLINYFCAAEIDTDKLACFYYKNAGSLTGRIMTPSSEYTCIENIGVGYGMPLVGSGMAGNIQVLKMSTTKVFVTYSDHGQSQSGYCVVATISGTTITFGTPVMFNSGTTYSAGLVLLETDKVLINFVNSSVNAQAVVVTVSGMVPTVKTPFVYATGQQPSSQDYNINRVSKISSAQVLVLYATTSGTYTPTLRVLSISGDTITGNAEVVNGIHVDGREITITSISSTKFLIAYNVSTDRKLIICNVSGTTPSWEVAALSVSINSSAYANKLCVISSSLAIISGGPTGNDWLIDISGSTPLVLSGTPAKLARCAYFYASATRVLAINYMANVQFYEIEGSELTRRDGMAALVQAGAGEQIEVSSIYASSFALDFVYLNGVKEEDKLGIGTQNYAPLLLANSPIVLTEGDKLYVLGSNFAMFGLKRT